MEKMRRLEEGVDTMYGGYVDCKAGDGGGKSVAEDVTRVDTKPV